MRYVLKGWKGDGSVPLEGNESTIRFTLDEPSTLEWIWQTEYAVELKTQIGKQTQTKTIWVPADETVDFSAMAMEEYNFKGWSGDIDRRDKTKPDITVTVDEPLSITKTYTWKQYVLSADAGANGSITPSGDIVIDRGGVFSTYIEADDFYHIDDIIVDEQSVGEFTQGDRTYTYTFDDVTTDHSIDVVFAQDVYTMTIASTQDEVMPEPGVYHINGGQIVTASVQQAIIEDADAGVRYVLDGWTGSGSVPEEGSENSVEFVIKNDSQLNWLWNTEYRLRVRTRAGGKETVEETWHPAGDKVALKVEDQGEYEFSKWEGDVPKRLQKRKKITVTMNKAYDVTRRYQWPQQFVEVTSGVNGQVEPAGRVSVDRSASQEFTITADERYHIEQLMVDGENVDVPEDSRIYTYTLDNVVEDHSIEVSFVADMYELTITSEQGDVEPLPGCVYLCVWRAY